MTLILLFGLTLIAEAINKEVGTFEGKYERVATFLLIYAIIFDVIFLISLA